MAYLYKNRITLHLHREAADRHDRRHPSDGSRAHVEARAVALALRLEAVETALADRAVVVRADVLDRIDLALDVAQGHLHAAHVDDLHRAARHLRKLGGRRSSASHNRASISPRMRSF